MIDQIEHVASQINKGEIKEDEARIFCLALHAALTHQSHVPRTFISHEATDWDKCLEELFNIPLSEVEGHTKNCLNVFGFSNSKLRATDCLTRDNILSVVEDTLSQLCGMGFVHYEHLRLSPFSTQSADTLYWIRAYRAEVQDDLLDVLCKREQRRAEVQRKIGSLYHQAADLTQPSVWNQAFKQKVDTEWQKHWGHSYTYQIMPRESAIIETLHLTEDI